MTSERTDMTRVLLADDEPLVRAGLAMLLQVEDDLVVVGEAGDGAQALAQAARLCPDVIVMDVRMPDMDGVEATRRLAGDAFIDDHGCTAAVLVLTTFHDDETVYAALRAGASGFLLKNAAPSDLASAIRAVAQGHAWLAPAVARKLLTDFAERPNPTLPTSKEMQRLTAREREVLVLVAHGLSNRDIAAHLIVSNATVRTHLGRILVKLGLHDRAQAVAAAYQSGLVRPGDAPPNPARPS
ncbi:response regulator [Streptomyces poonensis]|uniref:DNA-binding response regulator n=1 Tax=Streptomyces poonensis TaxID=68255 RepID=A0A918Q0Z6_9ACTN|nr:response regulator transcription factor [Streptomyces poonensis]GGZ29684.1 DNA-binding response regulator [Streptomyces poonensis]